MASDLCLPEHRVASGFVSLLTEEDHGPIEDAPEPASFHDLNLDQLVAALLVGREEYGLLPYFHRPLASPQTVAYRHEVLHDLETPAIRQAVVAFGSGLARTRDQLRQADKLYWALQQQDTYLRAASTYLTTVSQLADALHEADPASRGLSSFARHLSDYATSASFRALSEEAAAVRQGLEAVTYRLHIVSGRVHVSRDVTEEDYAADVASTFARFQQGQVESHLARIPTDTEMNHVEAAIAQLVAQLYPSEFAALRRFPERHPDFLDPGVTRFDREVQFYLSYLGFADRLRTAGLPFCYPAVTTSHSGIFASDAFDPALAGNLITDRKPVVCNDFRLDGPERLLVVTGPNQGGKTTFARMVGQLTYLASLGLPVPAREARLHLPDRILTHFERGENLQDLTGALEDDLVRIRDILDIATEASLVILNEIFTSTSLDDAVMLSTHVLREVIRLDCLCVCVTFLDELTTLGESTVSIVSQVDPDEPATRTFKVLRQRADGAAYAEALAEKHQLTYPKLKARLSR